ncbi:sensor histidine kinase [Streptomyces sp. NPDC055709]
MALLTKLLQTTPAGQADSLDFVAAPYQRRAQITQGILRLIIVVDVFADLFYPPTEHFAISLVIIISYAVWSVILLFANTRRWHTGSIVWIAFLIDLATVTTLTAITGGFTDPQVQPHNIFLLVPILAAFQYRPVVTLVATIASAASFVVGLVIGQSSSNPQWAHTLLFSQVILIVGAACVLLSWIQQGKMRNIVRLAEDRSALVARVMSAEDRERGALAETLHDGALQNVLAARQDLEELQHDPNAAVNLSRTHRALTDTVKQLRTSVSTLHPAVLDNVGLAPALTTLIAETAERGGFAATLDCQIRETGTADHLLYRTARELLINVVKHARASKVSVQIWMNSGMVHLEVADDGVGMPQEALEKSVAQGHIGLASHRIRIEEAGGRFEIRSNVPKGTVATVSLPC